MSDLSEKVSDWPKRFNVTKQVSFIMVLLKN